MSKNPEWVAFDESWRNLEEIVVRASSHLERFARNPERLDPETRINIDFLVIFEKKIAALEIIHEAALSGEHLEQYFQTSRMISDKLQNAYARFQAVL